MNLLSLLLSGMMSSSSVDAISEKTGVSQSLIIKLLPIALPILIKALTKNASQQDGALSLLGALSQHNSTKSIDAQLGAADAEDGSKILGHILGNNSSAVMSELAGESGLTSDQVNQILSNIAPALLSGLSAANTTAASESQISSGAMANPLGLMGLLGGAAPAASDNAELNGGTLLGLLSALAK